MNRFPYMMDKKAFVFAGHYWPNFSILKNQVIQNGGMAKAIPPRMRVGCSCVYFTTNFFPFWI